MITLVIMEVSVVQVSIHSSVPVVMAMLDLPVKKVSTNNMGMDASEYVEMVEHTSCNYINTFIFHSILYYTINDF
jgi:hypothetical protein